MDYYDAIELAANVLGLEESDDIDETLVEEKLFDKFGCGVDEFAEVAAALMKFTIPVRSPLSNMLYQGFSKDGCFIVKQIVDE